MLQPTARYLLNKSNPFIGLAVFICALFLLYNWLSPQRYQEIRKALEDFPASMIVQAAALAFAAYAVLTGYDFLALRFIRRRVGIPAIAATSLIANVLGNNFGNTLITGAAVRYWIYTSVGLSAFEITRVVLFCTLGFWLGFLLVCGMAFSIFPAGLDAIPEWMKVATQPLGLGLLALLAAYLILVATRRKVRLASKSFELPSLALTLGQILIASADLLLMTSVFYVLLPASADVRFTECLAAFLIALIAGNVSLVPGGLGVFESAMVLMLANSVGTIDLASALLMFRLLYFAAPLGITVALLTIRSVAGRTRISQMKDVRSRSLVGIAPAVSGAVVFFAGALLLYSGSLPAPAGRLNTLGRFLSLPLIEISHFTASLVGIALLLLARALLRRLDAAWGVAVVLLAVGAALSLVKGWAVGEAIALGMACLLLLSVRYQFYRKSSLLGQPLTGPWIGAIVMVLATSTWLMLFANRHALYAGESWWTFALHAEAPRSLRALVGAMGLAALLGWYRLLRPMAPVISVPTAADLDRVRAIIAHSPPTYANLALRGDKALLFNSAHDAFLMYGRNGSSWIAMGEPVGADTGARELMWQFRDLCDRFDGWCVFFEVSEKWRAEYAELGLALTPLGEEARVLLADFALDTPAHKGLRHTRAALQHRGCRFEILSPETVPAALPALARISNAWLAGKATREKGFSNASFHARYLEHFPVAIVRRDDEVIAFANLWLGAGKEELSIDLMRHLPSAPHGTMDFLFCELMLWGRAQGFKWFNLGMAPLSGLDSQQQHLIWRHIGTLLYRHGEHFYHFKGLRHYKAKFHPVWRPLYLASPGGVALPAILVDVTALIGGGLIGIISKRTIAERTTPCDAC